MYIEKNNLSLQTDKDFLSLFEKQYTREEVAKELGISTRTFHRYLSFALDYIPALRIYVDEFGTPNRRKFEAGHIEYMREVTDLLKSFTKERVITILTRKYSQAEE